MAKGALCASGQWPPPPPPRGRRESTEKKEGRGVWRGHCIRSDCHSPARRGGQCIARCPPPRPGEARRLVRRAPLGRDLEDVVVTGRCWGGRRLCRAQLPVRGGSAQNRGASLVARPVPRLSLSSSRPGASAACRLRAGSRRGAPCACRRPPSPPRPARRRRLPPSPPPQLRGLGRGGVERRGSPRRTAVQGAGRGGGRRRGGRCGRALLLLHHPR